MTSLPYPTTLHKPGQTQWGQTKEEWQTYYERHATFDQNPVEHTVCSTQTPNPLELELTPWHTTLKGEGRPTSTKAV